VIVDYTRQAFTRSPRRCGVVIVASSRAHKVASAGFAGNLAFFLMDFFGAVSDSGFGCMDFIDLLETIFESVGAPNVAGTNVAGIVPPGRSLQRSMRSRTGCAACTL
jgi:hypothetical protein